MGKRLITIAWVVVLMLLAPAMMAEDDVQAPSFTFYQPDEVLEERFVDLKGIAAYMGKVMETVDEALKAENVETPEAFDVVVVVMPGKKAKTWFVSSLEKPPARSELLAKLRTLTSAEVRGGPFAFAISFNLGGATRPEAKGDEFVPPMPEEWKRAAEAKGGAIIPDGIIDDIWTE